MSKKKASRTKLVKAIRSLSVAYKPSEILEELSVVYEEYSAASKSEAEVDYWLKCSRACGNLSSGTEKWLYELIDELEEDDNE